MEDITAGDGGAFGTSIEPIYNPSINITSSDTYARGDARNIFGNSKFKIQRRGKTPNIILKGKKKRKKSRKRS